MGSAGAMLLMEGSTGPGGSRDLFSVIILLG